MKADVTTLEASKAGTVELADACAAGGDEAVLGRHEERVQEDQPDQGQ